MLTRLINTFSVTNGCVPPQFFGLKPWYYYLETDKQCNVVNFKVLKSNGPNGAATSDIALILLAVVDSMLRIAGLVAVGFIIYGGILYVTSQGSAEQTQKAKNTIQNAIIGLLIAILATAIVSFLGNRLG